MQHVLHYIRIIIHHINFCTARQSVKKWFPELSTPWPHLKVSERLGYVGFTLNFSFGNLFLDVYISIQRYKPTSTSVAHRIFSSDPHCQVTQAGDAKQTLSSCLGERFSDPGVMKGEESNSVQTVLLESKHKTQSGVGIGNHSCSWHSCKFLFVEYKRKISSVQYVSM